MPTMDTAELRASFRRFAGHNRYSKFVRAINRACRSKGRLFFWQEQLWDEFVATQPDAPLTGEEVMAAFSVCDVHDFPLQAPPDDGPLPEIRDTPESEVAYNTLFPFAINGNLVCLQCRAARAKWIEGNPETWTGLPDRVTAIIVWWLVLAAAIGLPIYCFVPGNVMPHLRVPSALLLGALMTVSNIMLGQAIRWMDQHSSWANAEPTKQTAI